MADDDALIAKAAEALWPRGPGMLGWDGAVMKATSVIAAVRDQIAAEALREAADDLDSDTTPLHMMSAAAYLRHLADRLDSKEIP